jgi:hypothetical protein
MCFVALQIAIATTLASHQIWTTAYRTITPADVLTLLTAARSKSDISVHFADEARALRFERLSEIRFGLRVCEAAFR